MLTQKLFVKVALASALVMAMTADASANPWHRPHFAPTVVVAPAPVYRAPVYRAPVYQAPVYQTPVAYQPQVVYQTPVAYQPQVVYQTPVAYPAPVYRAPAPVYVPARPVFRPVMWHRHGHGFHHGRCW